MELEDAGTRVKFVLHDRDASFPVAFDAVFLEHGQAGSRPRGQETIMWTPLITLIALVLLTAAGAASAVALTTIDYQRAQRALTLLKILLGALLGSSGVLAAAVHVHHAGLL